MNTSPSRDTIRVLCLYDRSQPPPAVIALLARDDSLNFLGSFDVTPGPIAQLRDLDPNVAIVQLPMPALQVLRWISYLRRHLQAAFARGTPFQDFTFEADFPERGRRRLRLRGQRITWEAIQAPVLLVAIEDVTGQSQADGPA